MTERWLDYPFVELVDGQVVIFFEDGSESVWGFEENPENVIDDIENGLRAINFLRRSILDVIDTSFSILTEKGFSEDLKNEYLNEALSWITPTYSRAQL